MSKQGVHGGDVAGLLERFARLREKTRARTGKVIPFVVIQEGLKAMSSIRPRLRHHVGTGGRRLTGSTARRWFAAGVQAGRTSGVRNGQGTDSEEEDRRRLCRDFDLTTRALGIPNYNQCVSNAA
jgi:hypothetical protein